MTFEQQVARLEAIVAQLSDSKLELAQALKLFDEGVGLLRNAHEELAKVDHSIAITLSEMTCIQISSGRHSRQMPCGAKDEESKRLWRADHIGFPFAGIA